LSAGTSTGNQHILLPTPSNQVQTCHTGKVVNSPNRQNVCSETEPQQELEGYVHTLETQIGTNSLTLTAVLLLLTKTKTFINENISFLLTKLKRK